MSLATGGFALGATSTRSEVRFLCQVQCDGGRGNSTCSPFGPIRRTWETRISSLMRGSSLMMTPILSIPFTRLTLNTSAFGFTACHRRSNAGTHWHFHSQISRIAREESPEPETPKVLPGGVPLLS